MSNSSSFSPSPLTFQAAYLNYSTSFISELSFGNNLPIIHLRVLAIVRIFPEWIMSPELGKSIGRIATFSLWTGMFEMTFPSLLMKRLFRCDSVVNACLWEQGIPWEDEDDCWVGEAIEFCITTPYTPYNMLGLLWVLRWWILPLKIVVFVLRLSSVVILKGIKGFLDVIPENVQDRLLYCFCFSVNIYGTKLSWSFMFILC